MPGDGLLLFVVVVKRRKLVRVWMSNDTAICFRTVFRRSHFKSLLSDLVLLSSIRVRHLLPNQEPQTKSTQHESVWHSTFA